MNRTWLDHRIMSILTIVWVLLAIALPAAAAEPSATISLECRGERLEGTPLAWDRNLVSLLSRDGTLWEFAPEEAKNYSQTSARFTPYSYAEMRGALYQEFGKGFEVSGTGHYIVVHPEGQRDVWPDRFEQLYRSFQQFFSQRGFELQEPRFPLVAVVFGSRREFDHYAARTSQGVSPNTLGYYSIVTNRVLLYDMNNGEEPTAWGDSQNDATIIHEATHQTAFNTGIHNRFGSTPRWLGEGLGTMFEAPGVWNTREHMKLEDRVNPGRLLDYRQFAQSHESGALAEMVVSDRFFYTRPQAAYGFAWATMFYLAEREATSLSDYMNRVNARPKFEQYTPQQRMTDFQAAFGNDLRMLEVRIRRFMDELP